MGKAVAVVIVAVVVVGIGIIAKKNKYHYKDMIRFMLLAKKQGA